MSRRDELDWWDLIPPLPDGRPANAHPCFDPPPPRPAPPADDQPTDRTPFARGLYDLIQLRGD